MFHGDARIRIVALRRTTRRYRALLTPSALEILTLLERCSARCGPHLDQVFRDWLDLVEGVLNDIQAPLRKLQVAQSSTAVPPTADEVWSRLAHRYQHPEAFSLLSAACGTLIAGAAKQVHDDIGDVYMGACLGDDRRGQFFTPWHICMMMAQMTILDGAADIEARIAAAIAQSPDALAAQEAGAHLTGEAALAWRIARVLPHATPHIERITHSDLACGSARMLLAAAAQYPGWANALGLVSYVGADIDGLCCQMARLNFKLFGLDGSHAALVLLEAEAILERTERIAMLQSIMADVDPTVIEALADIEYADHAKNRSILRSTILCGFTIPLGESLSKIDQY